MSLPTVSGARDTDALLHAVKTKTGPWLSKACTDISRACPSIFATALINTLSDVTSPLLETQPPKSAHSRSLQPSQPTEVQAEAYQQFCKSIVRSLQSIDRRHSSPLALDLDPSNRLAGHDAPDTFRTDGLTASRKEFYHRRVMQMKAKMLAESCPGDWAQAPYRRLQQSLSRYAKGESRVMRAEEHLQAVITYRLDAARFIDTMVANLRLPQPYGQSCLVWDVDRWVDERRDKDERFNQIFMHLAGNGLIWEGSDWQGIKFRRGHLYLTAVLNESSYDMSEIESITELMGTMIEESMHILQRVVVKDEAVQHCARHWLSTIGKRSRV